MSDNGYDADYDALYGSPAKPTFSDEEEATYQALYGKPEPAPLDGEAKAAYDAVYDWSNVPLGQRPEHARPNN